jgi:hypothetical protein
VLGSKTSIALSDFIFKILPNSTACWVVRTFGLCMPAPPAALVLVLRDLTVGIMQGLEKDCARFVDTKVPDAQEAKAVMLETMAALYCLAVAVMATNADGIWSLDKPLFQWYTGRTFDLLQKALKESGVVGFRELVDECTELYLHDRPTLAEFTEQTPDYMFNAAELQPALAKNNWNVTFYLKAKTRILWRLGISTKQLGYYPLSVSLGIRLSTPLKVFQKFRPAFDEKGAETELYLHDRPTGEGR